MLERTFMLCYTNDMQTVKRPIAIAYRRVSTDHQGKSGLGLKDQDRSIREFCDRRGLAIEGEFTEIESGKNDARPQLARAIAMAKRKQGILVVATLSRLGRRVSFVSSMMDAGTPFACADAPDDEPFILHVKASFAEEEARKISARTKAALAIAKARGTKLGKPENLTLEARKKGARTMQERAKADRATIMPEILAARSEGLSTRAIAERVGVSAMTVSRLLRA
jgi:DNA invertase Pin-like site-specific DNA recombinase